MLDIDVVKVAESIEEYMRKLSKSSGKKCVVIGLSGGIDSAVLATLAVRAIGKEQVMTCHLKDRDSEKSSEEKARKLADWLGIALKIQDITHIMHDKGVYSALIMRLTTLSSLLNRLIQYNYYFLFKETPHKSSLKSGSGILEQNPFKRFVYKHTIRHLEKGFNQRHLYRREVVESIAAENECILLGAANRSESLVGWFVKDGIDDLPNQPLLGLYKTQVWDIAEYLELPDEICHQEPSPDMMKGITDEFAIGMRYRRLDEILDYLDRGLPEYEIIAHGVTKKELHHVQDLHRLSAWKRESPHIEPPVDGGFNSQYRMHTR